MPDSWGVSLSVPSSRPARVASTRRWVVVSVSVTALLLAVTFVGWTQAAPATVGPGTTEQGQGADVGERTTAYWLWEGAQLWHIPNPSPSVLSTTATLPTVLPAGSGTFSINAATATNTSVRWTFEETTAAPPSTELELRFIDGLTRTAAIITVYLETRTTAPTAPLAFILYWDAGAFAPTGITIQTMQVTVQACSSLGHCP